MTKHIPNLITSLNLLCGAIAILFTVSGDLIIAALFVVLGVVFDFFDGLLARLLNAQSPIGKELDSLADMVSFGIVPSLVMVQLLQLSYFGEIKPLTEIFSTRAWNVGIEDYYPLLGLLIMLGAAFRLAKFNTDTRQSNRFIGLPTPANALLILSLPLIFEYQYTQTIEKIFFNKWFLIGLTLLSVYLMNSNLSLFALKFKTWDFKTNKQRYVFLAITLGLFIAFQFIAIPMAILLYILFSLFWNNKSAA